MKNIYSNIFSYSKKTLHKTIVDLKKGNIVGLPTETVYGLAGNAYLKKSIKKIYKLKKRPKINPLIVHFFDYKNAEEALSMLVDADDRITCLNLYYSKFGGVKSKSQING